MRGEHLNGIVRLHAAGELDLESTPLLDEALAAIEALQPTTIILDFHELEFIDSSGLHALLRAHGRATESGRVLAVINGTDGVRKVFELTSTRHLLELAPSDAMGPSLQGEWLPVTLPGTARG